MFFSWRGRHCRRTLLLTVCVYCVVYSCWTAFHSIANVVLHPHGHTDSRLLMVCCKNQCVTIEESNWVWEKRTWRDRQGGQVTKGGGVDYISNWCHMDRHTGLYGAGCCVVKTGPFPNRVFFSFLSADWHSNETFPCDHLIGGYDDDDGFFFPERVLMMFHRHHRCGIFLHQRNSPVVSVNSRTPFVYAACIPSEIFSVMGDRLNWCDSL